MIINLIRTPAADNGAPEACHAEAQGVPAFRVAAHPFAEAEAEVKRRVLRSLADRANPPSNIAFVRTWEVEAEPASADVRGVHVMHEAQQLAVEAFRAEAAGDAPRKRQPRGAKR